MFHRPTFPLSMTRSRLRHRAKRLVAAATGSLVIGLQLLLSPVLAGDPFRPSGAGSRDIGDRAEAAFKAMFAEGDYARAEALLQEAETNEPMVYAMKASLNYLDEDWDKMGQNATLTRQTAEKLLSTDPLRGHLYTAVGHFIEGAHIFKTEGTVAAMPTVLAKLQQVFDHLERAERIAPNDPELNLVKGYMDLMLAVTLPFSNANDAINRLQTYAAPSYLAQRGIALGYRDLRQPDLAMAAVEKALAETPNNPDLLYLKAQILVRQRKDQESLEFFQRALNQANQLPPSLAGQIAYERCRANMRISNTQMDCSAERRRVRDS